MSTENATTDLNATIASAVQARIEIEVATALSGSDLMAQYVGAALHQEISVKDRNSYRERRTTYLREAIDGAIREATKVALARVLEAESAAIERVVAAEVKRNLPAIAKAAAENMSKAAANTYGMTVEIKYRDS